MKSNIKVAIVLTLALLAGCTVSAEFVRGDEYQSVVVERDDMRRVMNSTARLRAYNANGTLEWMGSGNVYKIENNRMFILSNNHVCNNPKGKITAEFLVDGKNLGEFDVRVDLCVEDDGIDIAVVSLNQGKTLKGVPFVPIRDHKVKVGDEFFHCGADAGHPQNAQLGEVINVSDDHFLFWPSAYAGDSGSAVTQFDEDGEPFIVGLVAWQTYNDNRLVGMAMKSKVVLDVLAGGDLPDLPSEGEVPPSNLETERLVQGLLERLREMREESRRERQALRDRLTQMQMEGAMQQEETRRFLDLFKKQQEESVEGQDSIVEKLSGRLDNLKTLLKWAFYGMVGLLVAALFFKQGWATTAIVCMITFVFRTGKLAYLLVHSAIVTKVKNPQTMSEALEELQEGISEGIGSRGDDSPS